MENGLNLKALQQLIDSNPGMKGTKEDDKIESTDIESNFSDEVNETVIEELTTAEEFIKAKPAKEDKEDKDTKSKGKTKTDDDEDEDEKKSPDELPEVTLEEDKSNDNDDTDAYKPWAETWKEKGYLDFEDKEYEEADDKEAFIYSKFEEKYEKDLEEFKEKYKENRSELAKRVIELEDNDIDITTLIRSEINIKSYEKIDPDKLAEDEALQKKVIKDLLIKSGTVENDKEAEAELKDYEENNLLAKKAERALPKLIQMEKKMAEEDLKRQEKEKKDQIKEYNDWVKNTNEYIKKNSEILPGIKLTDKEQKEIASMLTQFDNNGKSGLTKAIEKDPMKFNVLATYFSMKDWDLKALEKAAVTKATQKVKSTIATQVDKKESKGPDLNVFKKALKMK